jgi:hypothetical protein
MNFKESASLPLVSNCEVKESGASAIWWRNLVLEEGTCSAGYVLPRLGTARKRDCHRHLLENPGTKYKEK